MPRASACGPAGTAARGSQVGAGAATAKRVSFPGGGWVQAVSDLPSREAAPGSQRGAGAAGAGVAASRSTPSPALGTSLEERGQPGPVLSWNARGLRGSDRAPFPPQRVRMPREGRGGHRAAPGEPGVPAGNLRPHGAGRREAGHSSQPRAWRASVPGPGSLPAQVPAAFWQLKARLHA